MTEFRKGIFQTLKDQMVGTSFGRAIIYTIGHIVIAMTCNNLITGAELKLAALDALIELPPQSSWPLHSCVRCLQRIDPEGRGEHAQ